MKISPFRTQLNHPYASSVIAAFAVVIAFVNWTATPCAAQNSYIQHNLVSDIPGLADHTDPNLVNPWGISSSGGSPFWVSDNGKDVSTLYNSTGNPQALVVSVPPGSPTGTVFNTNAGTFNGDVFLFATEQGTIDGWRGALGTTAEILLPAFGAVFKGIATANVSGNAYIYATDFFNSNITVLPNTGAPPLAGTFTDPNLPAGYAPFNIQLINGRLLVTYALQDAAKHDDVAGAEHGFVDAFDLSGNFLQRLITQGVLNSPWGLAIAPANFGTFSNDLLVGNFGDGRINAFDPVTGALLGTLEDTMGNPITIEGLWGLRVGNGGNGGDVNTVYFAAGIPGGGEVEDHGLFGSIRSVPETGPTFDLLLAGLTGLIAYACALRLVRP
jgi:uncharacterized protein (TIGR03118 family)